MMRQALTVTYRDGLTEDVTATQYSLARFAQYVAVKGYKYDVREPGMMAVLQLRYMAWAELQRDATVKTTFEVWEATVDEVSGAEMQTVDPTRPAMSAG